MVAPFTTLLSLYSSLFTIQVFQFGQVLASENWEVKDKVKFFRARERTR